jgi:hypothetical protein
MIRWLIPSALTALLCAGGSDRAAASGGAGPAQAEAQPASSGGKSRVEIRDGWYYVDGRKGFVNALGYEVGARPGQHPYEHRVSDVARLRADLALIKAAGFNAIRTWSELDQDELSVVRESGLLIVFGIWVPPGEDFSDPRVVARDEALVRRVLSYSKRFDNIVTYLIMNEPMPEHIRRVGARATVALWTRLRDIIHAEHPGIPVTITGNAAIGAWVDMNLFDVYAYNAYDYDDGTNYTHRFANGNRFLAEWNAQGKPLVITEFGRSVSRSGGDHYGANTLRQQAEDVLQDYRELLDAGAAGACPFYFADGWWKSGAPAVHDDLPEEWFGFRGYADLADGEGYPRPVWHALAAYNEALVTSPRNGVFYQNQVPLEVFLQDDVARLRVIDRDRVIFERTGLARGSFSGTLSFAGEPLTDRELVLEFSDAAGKLLKLETLVILTGKDPVVWPTLELRTASRDLALERDVAIDVTLKNETAFTLGSELRYVFAPHVGWERGEKRRAVLDPGKREQKVHDVYRVPEASPVLGLYAGVDVSYGKFATTIYAQRFVYRGNWADAIRLRD